MLFNKFMFSSKISSHSRLSANYPQWGVSFPCTFLLHPPRVPFFFFSCFASARLPFLLHLPHSTIDSAPSSPPPFPLQAASCAHFSRFQFLPLLQSIQPFPSLPVLSIPIPIPLAFNSSIFPRKPREFPPLRSAFRSSEFCLLSRIIPFPPYKTVVFRFKARRSREATKWRAF